MIQKLILMAILSLFPIVSMADAHVYVKVRNKTNVDAVITANRDSVKWQCGDLCQTQVVKANSDMQFHTETTALDSLFREWSGLQTIVITYGAKTAKVQLWIDHPHDVDTNVKTAIVYLHGDGMGYNVNATLVGVGADTDTVATDIYVEEIGWHVGKAYVTLTLA